MAVHRELDTLMAQSTSLTTVRRDGSSSTSWVHLPRTLRPLLTTRAARVPHLQLHSAGLQLLVLRRVSGSPLLLLSSS